MGLVSNRFNRIYIVDTEFVALPGEKQQPVSVCALHYVRHGDSFKRAEDVRIFFRDGQQHDCPFPEIESEDTLFSVTTSPQSSKLSSHSTGRCRSTALI